MCKVISGIDRNQIRRIFISQSLCSHSAIFLFHDPIFVVDRVSGIGDDWLRRIIFSIIPVNLADTAADDEFNF
jgi:hypothetical protein